jgi:hypothetical protein
VQIASPSEVTQMSMLFRFVGLVFALHVLVAHATTVDVIDGVIGTLSTDQSFDGTQGVDLRLIAPVDLAVSSLTLREFSPAVDATLGARIYDGGNGQLLASANESVMQGTNQSLSIPISLTLKSAHTYRVAFFLHFGTANGIDVDPPGLPFTPTVERTGLFEVGGVFRSTLDVFPSEAYPYLPFIGLELTEAPPPIPEPRIWTMLGVGAVMLMLGRVTLISSDRRSSS